MAGKTGAFQLARMFQAAEVRQGRVNIQQLHRLPNYSATSFLPGSHEKQRHSGADVVVGELAPEIVFADVKAVIAIQANDRVLIEAQSL